MSLNKIVVLGPSGGRRLAALAEAAKRQGVDAVVPINYAEFVQQPAAFAATLTPQTWLRFESPDENVPAFRALYAAGAGQALKLGYPVLSGTALESALTKRGMLGSPAQIAFGLEHLLGQAATIATDKKAVLASDPGDVMLSYDKLACKAHLADHGIAGPRILEQPEDFEHLMQILNTTKGRRLFVKIRHGSGGAGTLALAAGPQGQVVCYTALKTGSGTGVFASKKMRKLTEHAVIRTIVEAIIPLGVLVETWVPKAGIDGRVCDLRLVAIRGANPFCVLRMSHSPITNLHLDAERGSVDLLWRRMSAKGQAKVMASAKAVLAAFPKTQMLGLDIAVLNDYRRHVVLEVNAFGDHIRRVLIDGLTPQDQQVIQMQKGMRDAAN